jgi:hypothetical protein
MSKPLTLAVRGPQEGKSKPYLDTPQVIPGKIIAGHYDEGSPRVAYFSYLKENTFGKPPWNLKFRTGEGINTPNASGISASHRGQWVNYTVQVQRTGSYKVVASLARPDAMSGDSVRDDLILLELDGKPLTQFVFSPKFTTGKNYWADYQPLPAKTVRLTEGTHVLRVQFDATPFNFGGLLFEPAATPPSRRASNRRSPRRRRISVSERDRVNGLGSPFYFGRARLVERTSKSVPCACPRTGIRPATAIARLALDRKAGDSVVCGRFIYKRAFV